MSDYDPKKDVGAAIRLLANILDKTNRTVQHLDTQANILIGVSAGLFALSIGKSVSATSQVPVAFIILAIMSAVTAVIALFAVHPPRFMRKRGQKESLFYQKYIENMGSAEKYEAALTERVGHIDAITKEYALEIYNMATYLYRPKRKLFNRARAIFLLGIICSFIVWLVR